MNLRKLNRILHRDLGYFFFGMFVVYGLSGIALNHVHEWNPNYIITQDTIYSDLILKNPVSEDAVIQLLEETGRSKKELKKFYHPNKTSLKIFVQNGSITMDLLTGTGYIEEIRNRPVFKEINFLHYNNAKRLWTWFSDIFAGAMIIIAITGLFILKGKNSIAGKGLWYMIAGIVIPLLLFLIYY